MFVLLIDPGRRCAIATGTNQFEQVHQYAIGTTEFVESAMGISAANRVRSTDGRIELSIRQSRDGRFLQRGI